MKLTDNTLKYLKEYGGLSFGERPFSHVDSLILCQLSYFKFQDLVPDLVEKMDGNDIRGVTMRSLRKHPKYNSLYVSDWYEKDNRRLYAAVARSRRFAKMRLNYYTNLTDKEMQMQFSAVTFLLEDGTVYVAFRGTDETIVGWREDFDMALKSPIPSQTAARLYLRHIAEYTGDAPLMIGGHSKGGNEAVFAAMETEPQIQDRIRAVYCFDGPGFREDIYRKEGYLRIEKKIIKMVPQDSFVGMLLHTAGSYQVVESSGKGVLQHDMFTWVVKEGNFVYKEEINPATEKKNQQINEWIASYSPEEQQEIVDALFEIIEATNGQECVSLIEQYGKEISLVLLDIVMPIMDGFEILMYMNRNHWIEDVPVIMISSEESENYIRKAFKFGVSDYISRPFDSKVVYQRVFNTIKLYAKQRRLISMVSDQMHEKEKNNQMMVEVLSQIMEFRNGESGLHVVHINTLTRLFLERLVENTDAYNLTPDDCYLISTASAFHDIGKVGIDESILNKPGKLTKEEFETMKEHTLIGASMLDKLEHYKDEKMIKIAYQICRWHHERYDGKGYPDGLTGEQIPIAAQVVSVADVYDALVSKRVYKDAYSHEQAMKMILNGECGAFNPLLMEVLVEIQEKIKEEK